MKRGDRLKYLRAIQAALALTLANRFDVGNLDFYDFSCVAFQIFCELRGLTNFNAEVIEELKSK